VADLGAVVAEPRGLELEDKVAFGEEKGVESIALTMEDLRILDLGFSRGRRSWTSETWRPC
jgi:hypothetical protein